MRRRVLPLGKNIAGKFDPVLATPYAIDYHGMERSGHNAIANWLKALMPPLSGVVQGARGNKPSFSGHPCGWHGSGKTPYHSAVLIYGGDVPLDEAPSRINHQRVVVSVRDVRNMLASRLKWEEREGRMIFQTGKLMTDVWKGYAREVLGDVTYFDGDVVRVFYDKWATSPAYRQALEGELAEKFGWANISNDVKDEVARPGGGSSFDKMEHRFDPARMDVTNRWKAYADDDYFNEVLRRDPEVLKLNERLLKEI